MDAKFKKPTIINLLLILLLSTTLITACSAPEAPALIVPDGAQAGNILDLAPCTFASIDGELAAECGTLVVPENRSDPNSRLIALPVTRIKAASNTPAEPIFWFSGGPGHPNKIGYSLDGLTENHDFVMVGYRGMEGQVVLTCPEVSKTINDAPGTVLSDEALAAYTVGSAQCAARLESEGIDLAGYTLTETIDDAEAVRVAFGYNKINLFGNSYGVRLEEIYMWRYPEVMNRVLLVSVNPPGHFIWYPDIMDTQIGRYAQLCAKDAACSARTDDLVATIREVKDNMPDRWMGIPIDQDAVKLVTYFMLVESIELPDSSVPLYGPAAVDLWLDAAEGDYRGMAMITLSKNLFLPTLFTWGHFLSMGVSSGDYHNPAVDYDAILNPEDSVIGAPLSNFLYWIIAGWPANTIDEEYFEVQPSDVEVLMVGGNVDFSTPPQYATEELLPQLSNAEQVILEDFGHTESIWFSQPEARAHLFNTFFDTGEIDASLYEYQPVDFTVEQDWGDLMRTFIIIIVVVIALIIVLVWLTIYLVRHRRARKA